MTASDIHDAALYDQLVQDPDDVEGLVAYARYKASERIWLRSYPERNGGRSPSDSDLATYIQSYDQYDVSRLQTEARGMLLNFANEIVEVRAPEIAQTAVARALGTHFDSMESRTAERFGQVVSAIAESRSWWRGIAETAIASVVVNVLTIILLINLVAPSLLEILRGVFSSSAH
jgi:hypothetical protein